MDPITLATITSALTLVASEVAKGAASEAGKGLWTRIKSMLNFAQEPSLKDLAPEIAGRLTADPELAKRIVQVLQANSQSIPQASTLVQRIDAEKVVVANQINVAGNFEM